MSTPAELLGAVEKSAVAVGAHDRKAWVGLFTPSGQIVVRDLELEVTGGLGRDADPHLPQV